MLNSSQRQNSDNRGAVWKPRVAGSGGLGRAARDESPVMECLTWKGEQGRIWKKAAAGPPSVKKGHCGHCVEDEKGRKLWIC